MSHTFELMYHYTHGVQTASKQIKCPLSPFNSGVWTFSHNPTSDTITCECKDVAGSLAVQSVALVTNAGNPNGYERSTGASLTHTKFPPSPAWSLAAQSTRDNYMYNYNYSGSNPVCVAKLVMTFAEDAAVEEADSQLRAEVARVGNRNVGK